MSEKHYVIALEKGIDKSEIMHDLGRDTTNDVSVDSNIIPDRTVDTVNNRPSSKRLFEMALTDEEAITLRNDSRVFGVDDPTLGDIGLDYEKDGPGTWIRYGTSTTRNNWGLLRHIEATNGWGTSTTSDRVGVKYTGHLDGTGVDYISHELDVARPDHEQWEDSNGVSRYQEFQWNTLPNMSGISTINYNPSYYDANMAHCTHVSGTAAGKDYGWATEAKIYVLPILALPDASYFWDPIKEFHKAKAVDPVTGVKRPTVVNASWSYGVTITNASASITFRGSSETISQFRNRQYGLIGKQDPADYTKFRVQTWAATRQAEVEEMQDEGVHYITSAGNNYQMLDVSGGVDFDNIYHYSWDIYYNRHNFAGDDTIVVGALDSTYNYTDTSKEQTEIFSNKGPRIDLWAAGEDIVSAYTSSSTGLANYQGTSMASPQVAGIVCLLLQANPGMTPAQVRTWLINNAKTDLMYVGDNDASVPSDYFSSDRNLMGSTNGIVYFPYSAHEKANWGIIPTGPFTFS